MITYVVHEHFQLNSVGHWQIINPRLVVALL